MFAAPSCTTESAGERPDENTSWCWNADLGPGCRVGSQSPYERNHFGNVYTHQTMLRVVRAARYLQPKHPTRVQVRPQGGRGGDSRGREGGAKQAGSHADAGLHSGVHEARSSCLFTLGAGYMGLCFISFAWGGVKTLMTSL